MSITGTGKIKREEFMIFADVSADATPEWELVGEGVEDMSIAMNPNVETVNDVIGNIVTTLDRYQKQTDVTPMRAKRESKLFAILYDIVKNEKTLSDVVRKFLCVNVFDASDGKYAAWIQDAVIAVQSYGGNTQGLDIPFNIHWTGEKTHGTFDPSNKTFTIGETPEYLASFIVCDENEAPLSDAQVLINGKVLTTNTNGIAEIMLPAGTYPYTVAADGYDNATGSIVISNAGKLESVTMTEDI